MSPEEILSIAREAMKNHDLEKAPEAFKLLEQAEAMGSAEASYAIGTWYLHGIYLKKNMRKAIQLLREAAKADIAEAAFDLAICYERGEGVRKSELKALTLLMRGFALGDLGSGQGLKENLVSTILEI
jgi:uncharacterized protein